MSYWNQPNFEGLREIAEAFTDDERLDNLAAYCQLREKGLRRQAFAALDQFLKATRTWDAEASRTIADRILQVSHRCPKAHQFLSEPLCNGFLVPTLVAWVKSEPLSATALRWLGLLTRDAQLLEKALTLNPHDVPARRRLIDFCLGCVEYATHHLDEGRFLGEIGEAEAALARARRFLTEAPEKSALHDQEDEINYYETLLADWVAYRASPKGTFVDWCNARGRQYSFPIRVYYDP